MSAGVPGRPSGERRTWVLGDLEKVTAGVPRGGRSPICQFMCPCSKDVVKIEGERNLPSNPPPENEPVAYPQMAGDVCVPSARSCEALKSEEQTSKCVSSVQHPAQYERGEDKPC